MLSGFLTTEGMIRIFFSPAQLGGPVTWGVCRPNVRNRIEVGDWVVFFSCPDAPEGREYKCVGALRVEAKIMQTEVFGAGTDPLLRNYLNLLIRPCGQGWNWYEPALRRWHADWLWRLSAGTRGRKKSLEQLGIDHEAGRPLPEQVAANYVIFSSVDAIIATNPPQVARQVEKHESWSDSPAIQTLRQVVLGDHERPWLFTKTGQPGQHRHLVREVPDHGWPDQFRAALSAIS